MSGAMDSNAFKANIESGNIPDPSSITYEGVFSEHFYNI